MIDPLLILHLHLWAADVMASRPPDSVIPDHQSTYIWKWEVVPTLGDDGITLHRLSDDWPDIAHAHPHDNASILIDGGYTEFMDTGVFERKPGDLIYRAAADRHRLDLSKTKTCLTLFLTGTYAHQVRDGDYSAVEALLDPATGEA